jgi:hypothetical protein
MGQKIHHRKFDVLDLQGLHPLLINPVNRKSCWKDTFADVTDVFNRSPMGKKASVYSHSLDILSKWHGSNTDHCSKEKKAAQLMSDAK